MLIRSRLRLWLLLLGFWAQSPAQTFAAAYTATPTFAPGSCSNLFNNAETMTINGTWSGANALRTLATSGPPGAITQGSGAIDAFVNVPSGNNWDWAVLSGFTPA